MESPCLPRGGGGGGVMSLTAAWPCPLMSVAALPCPRHPGRSGLRQDRGPFMAEGFSDHRLDAHRLWVITASRPFCGKNQELYIKKIIMNFKFNITGF